MKHERLLNDGKRVSPRLIKIVLAMFHELEVGLWERSNLSPFSNNGQEGVLCQEICSAFDNLPPYQCTETKNPSFISALGSSLAIVQTILFVFAAASSYLLQNGYGKSISPAAATKEVEHDTMEVEMRGSKPVVASVAANPMNHAH